MKGGLDRLPFPLADGWPMKHAVTVLFVVVAVGLIGAARRGGSPFPGSRSAGVVTGAACVLLVVARSIWNFPVGIASCAAYLVFFAEGRLYADAGLQVVFIVLGFTAGWPGPAGGPTRSRSAASRSAS